MPIETIRRIGPPASFVDSERSTVAPETGLPFLSSTRPLKAMPRGMVRTMPLFFSPEATRNADVFAGGYPFLFASTTTSPSATLRATKRPSGPLYVLRAAPRPNIISIMASRELARVLMCAAATGCLSSSTTVPATVASGVP
jgi:hypothetical protein